MSVIADVINNVQSTLTGFPEAVFNNVGPQIWPVLKAAGVLSLMAVALNQMFQFRQISFQTYAVWGIRYICIVTTASLWVNFQPVYNLIVDLPLSYASSLMGPVRTTQRVWHDRDAAACGTQPIHWAIGWTPWGREPKSCWVDEPVLVTPTTGSAGIYTMLDTFKDRIFNNAEDIMDKFKLHRPSTFKYLASAVVTYLIGLIFTATAIVVALISMVGLAVMMALAPLAVGMLTFNQTRGYFESWLRMTGGFALVPLLLVALMAVVITVGNSTIRGDDVFAGYMPFVLVSLAGLVLLFQIPTIASSLASVSLPQMGPAAAAQALTRVAQVVTAPLRVAAAVGNRAGAAAGSAQTARAGSSSRTQSAYAGAKAMAQSAQYRAERASQVAYVKGTVAKVAKK